MGNTAGETESMDVSTLLPLDAKFFLNGNNE